MSVTANAILEDFSPWEAAEVRREARSLYLGDFWENEQLFLEVFSACPAVDRAILKHLFDAFKLLRNGNEEGCIGALKEARDGIEELATEFVPPEYLSIAVEQMEPE